MAKWAEFADGEVVSENEFRVLAQYAPQGTLDVFASDQHGSYLRLIQAFLERNGEDREATDVDVRAVCRRFASALQGVPRAALFNHLAYLSEGFRELLGEKTLLIGRLEDTNTEDIDAGRGHLARLAVKPEDVADRVDGFKTLVKLDPDHQESWNRNRDWLAEVYERCRKLEKPLFNETLLVPRPDETKIDMARRLPEGVVKMAEDFGKFGMFYKTQVPVLWMEDKQGKLQRICSPDEVRSAAVTMFSVVDRPMLLLSAAVDFAQYSGQYALVSDVISGPMCGRAYFKEAFTDEHSRDWDTLAESFSRIALPRIRQIQDLAEKVSRPWWHKFAWMSEDAQELIEPESKPSRPSVRADYGY